MIRVATDRELVDDLVRLGEVQCQLAETAAPRAEANPIRGHLLDAMRCVVRAMQNLTDTLTASREATR